MLEAVRAVSEKRICWWIVGDTEVIQKKTLSGGEAARE
jgi:hypothetical protein